MKKLTCIVVSIILVFSLVACANNADKETAKETANEEEGSSSQQTTAKEDKPLEFTILADLLSWTKANLDVNESEELKEWSQFSNTKIKFITPPHANHKEKVNLLMASGDMPDVIQTADIVDLTPFFADQGQLVELDDYWNSEKGKMVKEKWYSEESFLPSSFGGKIYGIPLRNSVSARTGTMVRKDWLDKLGLKKPETLEQYREVLKAFTYNDPDGNGKDDTYGFTLRTNFTYMETFTGAFDIRTHARVSYDLKDGQLVPQQTQEKYKEYLKYMRSLFYEDKVIVPNGIVNTSDQWKKDMFTGIAGMWFHDLSRIDQYFMENMMQANPDWKERGIEIDYLKPPLNSETGRGGSSNNLDVLGGVLITKGAKDPKAIFDYFMWVFTDQGALEFAKYGLEGKHHIVKDGKKVWKEGVLRDESQWQVKSMIMLSVYWPIDDEEVATQYGDKVLEVQNHNVKYNQLPWILLLGKPLLEKEEEYPNIDSIVLEYSMKIVMGELEVDSGFQEMQKRLEANGLSEVTADRQKWYDDNKK